MLATYVKSKKTNPKLSTVHEGQLLKSLVDWIGISIESFCKKLDLTSSWFRLTVKKDAIGQKTKIRIYKEFDIPMEYWSGKSPLIKPKNVKYELPKDDLTQLREENATLKHKLLQTENELLRLMLEIKNGKKSD